MSLAVDQMEIRKLVAHGRHERAGAVFPEAQDQVVIGGLDLGKKLPRFLFIEVEPLGKGRLVSIRPLKSHRHGIFGWSDFAYQAAVIPCVWPGWPTCPQLPPQS